MFWKFGGYANISAIDSLLDRPDFTLEDLLDEDLLGDIKAHNNKLIDYIRQRDVLGRLLDYVIAPKTEPAPAPEADDKAVPAGPADSAEPTDGQNERGRARVLPFGRSRASSSATDGGREEDDDTEKKRNRYAIVSCEILSCDNWSICESLMDPSNRDLLHKFWQYIKRPVPLDPLQAGYFTKVNESLFDKKVEEMTAFLKTVDGAVQDMLRHVDCPMIMDVLLKIITLDRPEGSPGIVEWLYTQNLMPTLLSFLGPENSWATQTSAGDFIKAIITVSANATQNEQTCIGPNELTRQLVSQPCIDELINYMLTGGNALTVGVGIVIEVIRKNNSDYDPDVGTEANSIPSSRDPIYLGTLLRKFAENVPKFMSLMNNAPAQKTRLNSTFNEKIEPLGFDRFKTCELMAELLHCSNMGLLNEVGSEAVIAQRDIERHRLRREGKLTPNRGEEAIPSSSDLLTMRVPHAPASDEVRRLEVTNVSAADEDGFEEVTHAAGLGDEDKSLPEEVTLPTMDPPSTSKSFLDKDDDDFVDEPLSSPRLITQDEKLPDIPSSHFDDPGLMVAPLSPSKKKPTDTDDLKMSDGPELLSTNEEGQISGSDDFVTEATEPALGRDAKNLPDFVKIDDSDSSIVFTPTISSMSDSFRRRSPSPTSDLPETLEQTTIEDVADTESQTGEITSTPALREDKQASDSVEETVKLPAESAPEGEKKNEVEPETSPEVAEATVVAGNGNVYPEGEGSVVVAQALSEEPLSSAPTTVDVEPVVGDYLKMQFVEHQVVPTILSFFFSYSWNNFLHNVVYDVVQQVFNGPMDRGFNPHLAISLFESANITTQIINGQIASEKSQTATRTRMGYMGHLTLIAEEVVKFTERHPPELLSDVVLDRVMSQDWINYVEGPLAETRERDNAVLGGVRPDVNMGNQAAASGLAAVGLSNLGSSFGLNNLQGASSALADAGLNGSLDFQGNDGGISPFSISAGISSGFHSSSDEDDEDADENDEDVNSEFRAYTDPLNASSSSSMLPPAIPPPPPPPPPLNTPPSRARLQLAARLAMNKRNAEAAAATEEGRDEIDGIEDDNETEFAIAGRELSEERPQNPFADDEDDEDEDDDEAEDEDDDGDMALNGSRGSDGTSHVGLGWNRGGWWRSMVRRDRNNAGVVSEKEEKFGDGRDSSSDDEVDRGRGVEARDDDEDDEFGDFAMPEVGGADGAGSTHVPVPAAPAPPNSSSGGLFFGQHDPILFKPLAVHPPTTVSADSTASNAGAVTDSSPGGTTGRGLWPFDRLRALGVPIMEKKEKDGADEKDGQESLPDEKTPVGTSSEKADDGLAVIGEDGHQISRVKEAKRRTSLEGPDEDEVVV